MKISLATSVLAGATCVLASIEIPADLSDGLYTVHPDVESPSGHLMKRADSTHTRKRDLCPLFGCVNPNLIGAYPRDRALKELVPLPKTGHFCRVKEHNMTLDNLHEAISLLFYSPLFWIPPNSARFALYNGTVAYICNIGQWNSGSLVEYMEAMKILDDKCHDNDESPEVVRAAKLSVVNWDKFYGREVAGVPICQWESEPGGIKNELQDVQKAGCKTYVSGISRALDDKGYKCNEDAAGLSVWNYLRKLFPWYSGGPSANFTSTR